jgi:hypothetical protein
MPISLEEIADSMDAKEFQNVASPSDLVAIPAFQFLKSWSPQRANMGYTHGYTWIPLYSSWVIHEYLYKIMQIEPRVSFLPVVM